MPRFPDFAHLDLSRLTLVGWLLLIVAVAVVVAGMIAERFVLHWFGYELDSHTDRTVAGILLIVALAAAGGVFQLGRKLAERAGYPILR